MSEIFAELPADPRQLGDVCDRVLAARVQVARVLHHAREIRKAKGTAFHRDS